MSHHGVVCLLHVHPTFQIQFFHANLRLFWVYMKLMRKVINDMLATHPKKSEESVKTHFVLVGVEVHYVSNPPR
jgi:hypothetical protein